MLEVGDRVPLEAKVWLAPNEQHTFGEIVASYKGLTASTSRNDAMQARPAENRAPAADPPARDETRQ